MGKKRLGDVLRERGHISIDALTKALQEQQRKTILLGEVLLQRRVVHKQDLVTALEEVTRIRYVDCQSVSVDPVVLKRIPRGVALRHCVLPIGQDGDAIITVMAEPQNLHTIDELRFVCEKRISPRFGFRAEILAAIEKHYGGEAPVADSEEEKLPLGEYSKAREMEFISTSSRERNRDAMKEFQAELRSQPTPAVRLVSAMIAAALAKDASDIHIEPQAAETLVRLRVDGVLRELARIPGHLQTSVISRVKILADLDIAERRTPQDGRFLVQMGAKRLDLRVSTLPTHYGEKIVMRLLDPSAPRLHFEELGLSPEMCETFSRLLALPQGMVLVTGPTGSGKTTTLYAALHQVRSSSVNIITVEDPVEYMLEGINQVQVHSKAGLTFAKCLRSILRQDPNIIMVGEIRDAETAEIALKSAQTGHLVLTTVHTNDSIAAVSRLLDLKIPPFLIASSVSAIISQRLVRKLCACRAQVDVTPEYTAHLLAGGIANPGRTMYSPVGCPHCDYSGYKGRIGVFEMLVFDEHIRGAIRTDARPEEIRALARSGRMRAIQEDALDKARTGLTTLAELLRVVPFEQVSAVLCLDCGRELAQTFMFCPYCGTRRRTGTAGDRKHSVPVPATKGGEVA